VTAMERRAPTMNGVDATSPERPEFADGAEPALALAPLTELAGFMLRLAQLRAFEAFFAEFGRRGIRPGQISILTAIGANPGVRQGALAKALSIKRSNMAKIVGLLESEGLIRRRVPRSDRRSVELYLSAAGQDFVDGALPDIHVNDREATAMLTERERTTLMRLLHKMTGMPAAARA
jgi:DNA-binding MarR family transcriptional regulator